jgi:SAM-dependent methyltransferase
MQPYDPARTAAEVAFVARQLPLPAYQTVLDVCCGPGRHALPLAGRGYQVTGVDRDAAALAAARQAGADFPATFVQADMRALAAVPGPFDAAICLWQSFGYFDAATNAAVLGDLAAHLRPGGRLILDLNHRAFYLAHQGERHLERDGRRIHETSRVVGDRQLVTLTYDPPAPPDRFEWQLYTPADLTALAAPLGLALILSCTGYDETRPATPAEGRMQLVFARHT